MKSRLFENSCNSKTSNSFVFYEEYVEGGCKGAERFYFCCFQKLYMRELMPRC